jgi:hypothetical protein
MSESPVTESSPGAVARGHCLCGGVRFEIHGPLRPIIYCHCTMCRRASGHFDAATACAPQHLRLLSAQSLRWYRSSAIARRGFCGTCGSQLFWEPAGGGHISIWAGTLDTPTGLEAAEHIFVADKGDYYEITDGLPQHPGGAPEDD